MKNLYVIAKKTKRGDVEIYMPSCKPLTPAALFCTFDKFQAAKPDYRNKYVILNCYRYNIMWNRGEA
jgi:hypothetical protein